MSIIDGKISIQTSEIKAFLAKEYGDRIRFCPSDRRNESLMIYSSELTPDVLANHIRSNDVIKEAAKILRDALTEVNFGLDDKFCDAEELKHA